MAEEKIFVFYVATSGDKEPERCEKKESELNQQEKDLLLGALFKAWNDNIDENRIKFMQNLFDGARDNQSDKEQIFKSPVCTCDTEKIEPHPCPYNSEINNDNTECTCCSYCQEQCNRDT